MTDEEWDATRRRRTPMNEYPFADEIHKNMKEHVNLPIQEVTINSYSKEFVTVDVRVVMTRQQLQRLFDAPAPEPGSAQWRQEREGEWKDRTSDVPPRPVRDDPQA